MEIYSEGLSKLCSSMAGTHSLTTLYFVSSSQTAQNVQHKVVLS